MSKQFLMKQFDVDVRPHAIFLDRLIQNSMLTEQFFLECSHLPAIGIPMNFFPSEF